MADGRYEEVANHWQMQSACADPTSRWWPYTALNVVYAQTQVGDGRAAHALLDEITVALPNHQVYARCHLFARRGRLHLDEGRTDLAGEAAEQAMALVPELRARDAWAWTAVRDAQVLQVGVALARGRNDEVEKLVDAFLADKELYLEAPIEAAMLRLDLASVEEDRQIDAPSAERRAESTFELARIELQSLPLSPERERLLANAELALARLAIDTGDLRRSGELLAHVSSLSVSKSSSPVWEPVILAGLQAQLALEKGADRNALEQARVALDAALTAQLGFVARLTARPDGLSILHFRESRAPLIELIRLDVALEGEAQGAARGLERIARLQSLGTLARRYGADAPTLEEIRQELLGPDDGLFVVLPEARRSVVLALDRSTVLYEEIAGFNRLQRARLRHLGSLLFQLPSDAKEREEAMAQERAAAHELAKLLFTPRLSERLRQWKGVTFVGLDTLGPVALGWLPLGESPHLGRVKAWGVLPSIPFGVARARALDEAASTETADLLLVGSVRPDDALMREHPELVPLPLSDDVVRSLERSYSSAHVLAGGEATPTRVLAEARGHRVVQFLVHTLQDSSRARPTGLVLEPEEGSSGILWADAVAEQVLDPHGTGLVVLASCRSAQGPTRRGDAGSADLAGAWLSAGVPAALVSHSELTWGPTIELSEAFHNQLRSGGCSPAEALRRALHGLVADDERTLPFRYGLLEVVGLGNRPIFPK